MFTLFLQQFAFSDPTPGKTANYKCNWKKWKYYIRKKKRRKTPKRPRKMVSLYPTLVSDCTPMLDTVCATTLCVRHTLYSNPVRDTLCTPTLCEIHFVLCSCVRHSLYSCSCVTQSPLCQTVCALPLCQTLCSAPVSDTLCVRDSVYSTPLIDTHPCATQFVPCPYVIYSLCPAPVSDPVLCPGVRCTLCQRQCVFHPSDRHLPLFHTVCALPSCWRKFVLHHCVRQLCRNWFYLGAPSYVEKKKEKNASKCWLIRWNHFPSQGSW